MSSRTNENSTRLINDETLPEIYVGCEVRILSVDDAEETFQVALLIHAHYDDLENRPDPKAIDGFERDNNYTAYIPEMTMVNCLESQYEDFQKTIRRNKKTATVWVSYYNTCVISESLELEKFPFDRQLFRLPFKSANGVIRAWKIDPSVLDFPPPPPDDEQLENEEEDATFLVACELKHWQMHSFFVEYFSGDEDPASLTQGEMQLTIKVERDPKYYFFNFYLIMYLIVLANMCLMSIPTDLSAERNGVTITLLLTLVAFKFVLMEGTPKVGYLTYMDKYVVLAFVFTMIAIVENIFISPNVLCSFSEEPDCDAESLPDIGQDVREIDLIFQMTYGVIWTLINVGMAIICSFPTLVRTAWKVVEVKQIGATGESLQRTGRVTDGTQRVIGATMRRPKPGNDARAAGLLSTCLNYRPRLPQLMP